MAFIEVNGRKFEATDSTTAEQLVDMMNSDITFPVIARLVKPNEPPVIDRSIRARIAERKADRICQKAEANQRFKKGMSWK